MTPQMKGGDQAYLVLCLRLWGLKGACEDGNLGILYPLWHLWMTHVLVNDNAVHQLCIL